MAAAANDCSDSLSLCYSVIMTLFISDKIRFLCCCRKKTNIPLKGSGAKRTAHGPKKTFKKEKTKQIKIKRKSNKNKNKNKTMFK